MTTTTQPIAYQVNGVIYDEYDSPLQNVLVKVFDKDLRTEKLLVEKLTDSKGTYTITFKAEAPLNPEYKNADVLIKVIDSNGQVLGQSPVYFNVEEITTINYKIGNTPYKGLNEFDALVAIIQPIVKSSNLLLGDLQQNDKFDDFNFLASETGEDAERIRLLNTAFAFAKNNEIAPDIFYGLFRLGFPIVLNELLLLKASSIKQAIQQAIVENIISSKFEKGIEKIKTTLNGMSVKKITDGDDEQSATFKKLFGTLFTKKKQQEAFIGTYFDNEETPEIFWDKLKVQAGFTDAAVKKTKQLLSLNLLIDNQSDLAAYLISKQSTDNDLKEMSGYAKFSSADWVKHIKESKVKQFPAWVKGETTKEKIEHYAASLEQQHKQLYPTAFFAARMKQDNQSSFSQKQQLQTFFSKNPGFELGTKNIHKQLAAANFSSLNKKAVTQELKKINRLYKLTDDYKNVNALYSKGLFSSYDIVNKFGKEQFVKQFAIATGGTEEAIMLYKKAVSVNNKSTALITAYKMRHDVDIYAISGNSKNENAAFLEGYFEMFGDGERCECEHCQSVYSPAAYFVDMLNFIKSNKMAAYDELLRRRPDLDDILLTCKNTNTPLPYIDLVNELLEKEVVKISGISDTEGINAITHSYQTEGLTADLNAIPEHRSRIAYNPLKTISGNAAFSSLLPLDLPLEEIRAYTEKLGWKRIELINAFYGNNAPGKMNDEKLAAELLGISPAELKIITGETAIIVSIPLNTDDKCVIKQLLDKTKLTYIELLQLLETYFLNPPADEGRIITIEQPDLGGDSNEDNIVICNLDKLFLNNATDEWLNKAIRFVRLWKKTGWDIFDLDRILISLKPQEITLEEWDFSNDLIVSIAHFESVRQLLNLTIKQSSALFSDIDTNAYLDHTKEGQPAVPSLYEDIFKNIIVTDTASLSAALSISAKELTTLENTSDYSMSNLSMMYRTVLLAKAMGISINDLYKLQQLTGQQIEDAGWTPQQLFTFLQDCKIIKSVGIKTDEFETYFIAASDAEYTIPVNYNLLKQTSSCVYELSTIINDKSLTEEDRKLKCGARVAVFLTELEANTPLNNALAVVLTNPADTALKTVIENYLGNENREKLSSLPPAEITLKIEALQKSFLSYLEINMKKAPAIFHQLKFSLEETVWMKDNKIALGINLLWNESTDFESEEFFTAFKKLYWLSELAKYGKNGIIDILEIAIKNGINAKAILLEKVGALYGVTKPSLEFLCGSDIIDTNNGKLNFVFPDDYLKAENIITLLNCCWEMEKLGGSADQMDALLSTGATPEGAQIVQNLLRSKYSSKEWLDIIKPISDTLRTRQRDALTAWLLANGGLWQSANDIYEYLLIDTEMSACMVTSRIKQGISSIQLFIDRCLMNLERDIQLNTEFAEQWHQWRKLYRVWEANRKIFLYPENWIEPDLRDDKSPFFKELESQLKQNELTEETAKEALITYLQKLDTVANLEIVGLFNDEETKIVHVFGRTHNIPHQYFYRKQENNVWTAWENVELDIEGDHILPVVWNGRLMLFWGMFTEKQKQRSGKTSIKGDIGDMSVTTEEPKIYYEMKLAWSEYKNGKWGAKKISKDAIIIKLIPIAVLDFNEHTNTSVTPSAFFGIFPGMPLFDDTTVSVVDHRSYTRNSTLDSDHVFLSSFISGSNLHIKIFQWDDSKENQLFRKGDFIFNGCNSSPELFVESDTNSLFSLQEFKSNKLSLPGSGPLILNGKRFFNPFSVPDGNKILEKTPSNSVLIIERDSIKNVKRPLFFLSNKSHTFFVKGSNNINTLYSDEFENVLTNGFVIRRPHKTAKRSISTDLSLPNNRVASEHSALQGSVVRLGVPQLERKYNFQPFYYPQACGFLKSINQSGVNAMFTLEVQQQIPKVLFNSTEYKPSDLVVAPFPQEELEYAVQGAYSLYNWELFYHIPLLIATRLTQNHKFEEARKWFHYIFDPTMPSSDDTSAKRFWITKPFRKEIEDGILSLEDLLSKDEFADELEIQLANWEANPFNRHAVARLRISAYMRNIVLRYIDNLIQWGDQLFRRDTIESINEATQLYILASNILGKKQEVVPARAKSVVKSFNDIKERLDRFRNVKSEIESFISPSGSDDVILMPYFCLPKNDYLLKYWDTVADRLFKIRHCMNIEGVVRQLPLFEPPIDPGLLVRAKAAGLDLNTILNDVNISLPNYRFTVMLQKANELCNDVQSLGNSLLSALEKRDGEELALLRSSHELRMLNMIKDVKEKQRDEDKENLESLINARLVTEAREMYYTGREFMNVYEKVYFASVPVGMIFQNLQIAAQSLAAIGFSAPDVTIGPFSSGATIGGNNIGNALNLAAGSFGQRANLINMVGTLANTYGSFKRREDDWKFQAKSAELELKQIDKQIIAAEIRLAIAEKELENHSLQMEQSKEVDDYMSSKFTNAELYDWMTRQLSTVYFHSYQLAFATAKKAEKCMQYELGLEATSYIQFGYWDSLKKGLLSGEKLQFDLRRLENAYLEENKREYEIVKHVSLVMNDPLALISLRSTGACEFEIPEVLYDMDHPGHYFRRLKSVSISLPCIAGPYTSVSAKLSLSKSHSRIKEDLTEDSLKEFGNGQSIATSNAQNDSGVFELNFRDERYLPFEGTGAVSKWKLELPNTFRQFDYNTISDVIVHVKYTSREGNSDFKNQVVISLSDRLNKIAQHLGEQGLHIAINMKHDLSNEWHQLKTTGKTNLKIDMSRLPYIIQQFDSANIESVIFVAKITDDPATFIINVVDDENIVHATTLEWVKDLQLSKGNNSAIVLDKLFTLSVANNDMLKLEELLLVVKYKF